MNTVVEKAKLLRQNGTKAEILFWRRVRNRQLSYKFYRQMPVKGYIADFVCPELKLIVEIDGGQHAENKRDEIRTRTLAQEGYCVIRFWNNDVLSNIDGVLVSLTETLEQRNFDTTCLIPSPQPSPPAGEREQATPS